MSTFLGFDLYQLVKLAMWLIVILAIVGGAYLLLRRLTGARLISSGSEQNRNRQPRLGVVDVYDLDRTRQLVLLRRDNVEHLLLIGGPNDTVIETNIVRVTGGKLSVSPEMQLERAEAVAVEPAMRPVSEQPMRPVIETGTVRPTVASRPFAAPSVSEPMPTAQREVPMASQATVAAASFAAVAAATQHEIDTTPAEVPDFLRTPHEARGARDAYPRHDLPARDAADHSESVEEIALAPPAFAEPEPYRTAYAPAVPPFVSREPEPVMAPEPSYVEPVIDYQPVVIPEPAPVNFPDFEPAQHAEPEPVFAPALLHELEERWPRHTPFAGIDSSIGDYTKHPPHAEPVHLEPVHIEQPPVERPHVEPIQFEPIQFEPIQLEPAALEPVEAFEEHPVAPAIIDEPLAALDEEPAAGIAEDAPAPAASLKPDETMFSNMARQLEEALARSQAAANAPVWHEPVTAEEQDVAPVEASEPEETALPIEIEEMPLPYHDPVDEPVEAEAEALEPVVPPAVLKPVADDEIKPKPASATAKSNDPFSLDDIEAEFARLLGRSDDKSGKV